MQSAFGQHHTDSFSIVYQESHGKVIVHTGTANAANMG